MRVAGIIVAGEYHPLENIQIKPGVYRAPISGVIERYRLDTGEEHEPFVLTDLRAGEIFKIDWNEEPEYAAHSDFAARVAATCIQWERDYQLARWGNLHDDRHSIGEMVQLIEGYLRDVVNGAINVEDDWSNYPDLRPNGRDMRKDAVKAATLSLALLEKIIRSDAQEHEYGAVGEYYGRLMFRKGYTVVTKDKK